MNTNITNKNNESLIPLKLYSELNETLISMDPADLLKFLPLVNAIVVDNRIDPTVNIFENFRRKKF